VAGGASSTSVNPSVIGTAEGESAGDDHDDMDLTYSLFPPKLKLPSNPAPLVQSEASTVTAGPVDATTSLQSSAQSSTNTTKPPTKSAAATTPHEPPTSQSNHLAEVSGNEQHGKAHDEADISPKKRKRLRPPSPDVIPNPVGSSYGLDLDYFMYSSEDEDEDETEQTEPSLAASKPPEKRVRIESPPRPTTTPKGPAPTAVRTETEVASPYIAPGWNRPTTTVYNGSLFQGRTPTNAYTQEMPQPREGWPHLMNSPRVFHPQPSTGSLLDIREDHRRKQLFRAMENPWINGTLGKPKTPQFAPTPSRTAPFTSSRPSMPQQAASSNAHPSTNMFAQPSRISSQPPSIAPSQPSTAPLPPQPSAAVSFQPSAITPEASTILREDLMQSKNEPETNGVSPLENVEPLPHNIDATEKHKPKSPSKLRNPTRFSSSPAGSPARESEQHNEGDLRQVFGEDEAGQQAYDLFQSCPSGDLSKLSWPKFAAVPNDEIQQMVNATNYTNGHEDEIRETFHQSFYNFQKELDEGLVDTDELLEDLPI
jgi:hypothetical protein